MSRKRRQTESGIGSDSFLDIIANIVGILIILIVVAGVRIGQTPVSVEESPDTESSALSVARDAEPASIPMPDHQIGTTDAPVWHKPPTHTDAPEPIVIERWREHSPEERSRHQQELAELERLEQRLQRKTKPPSPVPDASLEFERLTAAQGRLDSLNEKLRSSQQSYESRKSALTEAKQFLSSAAQQVATLDRTVTSVQQQLAGRQNEPAPFEILRHDATPVSEEVKSRELHFVIQRGKVAEVPLDALLEQVREQIERRKEWILRSNKHHGIAGPIRGFKLDYLVERQTLSTLDQLRVGTGLVRIGLTKWTIERDPESLIEENLAQATGSTSRFLVSIRSAPPDAACTFWVYPDSFSEYQKLKQLVHASGLRVSGRPLPNGIPIGGSPQGSRSAAQ